MKSKIKRVSAALGVSALALALTIAMTACTGGNGYYTGHAGHIGMDYVNFNIWPDGEDGYVRIGDANVTQDGDTVTVKVAHDYDMVGRGVELDFRGFFDKHHHADADKRAWGQDLYFRRTDSSYAANEVGRAYTARRTGDVVDWVRVGVTPEESRPGKSSRIMLSEGEDGKILNYVFFGSTAIQSKEVIFTIRTHHGHTRTLTLVIEKKQAPENGNGNGNGYTNGNGNGNGYTNGDE